MSSSHEQLLISRIIDHEASSAEWREFEASADANPQLWRNLAQTQRDHSGLANVLDSAATVAECVDVPHAAHHAIHWRFNRLSAWSGWAVAALIAVVASVQYSSTLDGVHPPAPGSMNAGFSIQSAADAWQAYLQKGRESGEVVGEIPNKLLVDSKPALSGNGVEVIYVRQVMERAIVPDLYEFAGRDEAGRPTLVRYAHPVRNSM